MGRMDSAHPMRTDFSQSVQHSVVSTFMMLSRRGESPHCVQAESVFVEIVLVLNDTFLWYDHTCRLEAIAIA